MNRLVKWWKAEPVTRTRQPVIITDVETASLPSAQIAEDTRKVEIDFIQELLKLGRRSAALRLALGQSALNMNGRLPK